MDFRAHTDSHIRLTILRFLLETPGYTANAATLKTVCEAFALVATRDQIHTAIGWLDEQRLVERSVQALGGGVEVVIATLTERGADVARGHARVDGVARPSPRPRLPGGPGTAG